MQHATGADAQQVRDDTRHLDVRFLEQGLQPILELHAIAGHLVLAAHHGAPESLLGVGHEAQGELLRDQPFHQPLSIGEILLASAGAAIRLRLSEMEGAREPWCAVSRTTTGTPMLLECLPHRPPVLRGRFHDDFFDLALDQPVSQATQVERRRAGLLAFEAEVAVDLHVGTTASIFLCTSIPAIRYGIGLSLGRAESVPRRITQGRELSWSSQEHQRRSIIRSITHAPGQTVARPRLLHG